MFNWNNLLFRSRKIIVGLAALLLLYTNIYLWFFIPFSDFEFNWRPDDQLIVEKVPKDSPAASYLQAGDEITAVNGKPVSRSGIVFTEITSSYDFTIHRGGKTVVVAVPFPARLTSIGVSYRSPSGILSAIFLVVGAITLFFAKRGNHTAVRVGYIFVGSAVSTMGIQAELLSVPGAWLTRPLWYLPIFVTPYLGFIPQLKPLSDRLKRILRTLLITAIAMGVIALLEAIFLFPRQTSLQRITGYSPYELALLTGGVAWMAAFFILIVRAYRMKRSYERQQIVILLFFIGLAILPVAILTLIPRSLFDIVFIPFPVAISLFILVPAGYFFVIYRRGYLGLDIVFSKTIIFITLSLAMATLYGSGLAIINRQFDLDSNIVLPATLLLIPILMLTRYSTKPLDDWIHRLFFGQVTRNDSLPEFWSALSSKPELTTLNAIASSLAKDFDVPRVLLVLTTEDGILTPVAEVNVDAWQLELPAEFRTFHKPLLRSSERPKLDHPLFHSHRWIELLVPVIVRGEQIGFLAMSRPKDGYFNAEQVIFLTRAADMIAIGSEAIFLFEAAGKWSLQLLTAREMERKHIASLIHDRPLQTITLATDKVSQIMAVPHDIPPETAVTLKEQTQSLKAAMSELREICVGLFPPVIEQGLDLVVEEVTRQYEDKFELNIERHMDILDETVSTTDLSTVIYRVLTEALNNVVRHAQTRDVAVHLTYHDSHLIMEVVDNGIGNSLSNLSLSELSRQQHIGVRGMIEWARMVDGQLSIQNNKPQGTKVVLDVPVHKNGRRINA